MLYLEYAEIQASVKKLEEERNKIRAESIQLFERTQPKSVDYKKERVKSQPTINSNDSYVIALERRRIDERAKVCKGMLDDAKSDLKAKESELEASNNRYDKIYYKFYIKCHKVGAISKELNYSRSQINRMLKEIRANIGRLIV